MAQYTTELRTICQWLAGNKENESAETVIAKAAPFLFDFYFPFYDENKRVAFEQKFIRHFYMREIAHETFGLWKLALRDWLAVEMPYYNKLYETAELQYQPFDEVNYTKSGINSNNGKSTTSNIGDGKETNNSLTRNYFNDTPQDNVNSIETGYLTSAQKTDTNGGSSSHTENSGNRTTNESGTFSETVKGKVSTRSYSEMLEEYRNAIINVDRMVFNAMNELFMQIY